jgi:hypothetical protein
VRVVEDADPYEEDGDAPSGTGLRTARYQLHLGES